MEQYNWIKAKSVTGDSIFVRQGESGSKLWLDERGKMYDISDLDFTQRFDEPKIFNLEEYEKCNKEIEQQYKENQTMYLEMLSKMDANAIADHKAKIDEMEYWRKLRGDIFLEYCKRKSVETTIEALNVTDEIIKELHAQDQEFFKDK